MDPDFLRALMALHRELRGLYAAIARRFGLTPQQIELLCLLKDRSPSLGELATLLGCDKTNITGMVDRLERRSFLTRVTDRSDRRISRLALTEEGEALGAEVREAFAEVAADRWAAVSPEDCAALTRLARS
ncbi:MarR family transcriptional regulator [Saccharopolyspora sp. K220]|uniref:MarR family winged helix-turn-helix transcriptional regulator n=1 Tax=Saccharopolyspora soli TaxID=2926618 RepID=UPI001F5AF0C0|nr:MarR family transcriptional regulator [Saccharopolyspora soli]MCI2417824.1 MarR family transcriptional regulator [Saccharopolyspora soli]